MSTRRDALLALLAMAGPRAFASEDATPLLREVRQRLVDEPVVRGAFEQRKTIKGFRNPVLSSGEFLVVRQRGVAWRTLAPFPSTLVVTRDRIVARQADGTVARRINANEEPAVRAVSETLFGVMAADFTALVQRFTLQGDLVGREGWRLALLPRDAALGRWIQRVELEGDRFLRGVRLHEGSGDLTAIALSRHSAGSTITTQEEALLE